MNKMVLIVEDDLDMIYIHRKIVQNLGHDSIVAVNGQEAVDKAFKKLPDLILMDIMMPKMTGLQATLTIRENPKTCSIPILALTAMSSRKYMEKCLEIGCDDYLSKPFSLDQLHFLIVKLLDRHSSSHDALLDGSSPYYESSMSYQNLPA